MVHQINLSISISEPILKTQSLPLLSATATSSSGSSLVGSSDSGESPPDSGRFDPIRDEKFQFFRSPSCGSHSYRSVAVLSGHTGSVSSLALCGEFVLSASQGKDIIVWQHPDLTQFTKFGQGDGSVKALAAVGNRVFTAHQDSRIRVWKVSKRSENVFRLVDTLPTTKDYLGKFMKQSNYVQTRRNHKRLWIEHQDTISCLTVSNGLVYSGSWDKTLKVWRTSDLKCLESIKAHDDAINGLASSKGIVYSASADGKIKAWGCDKSSHFLKGILEGHKDVSVNSVVVSSDGRWVYGGGSDGFVVGWEGNPENEIWKIVSETKTHQMAVLCMCLKNELLFTGSADKSINVWRREAFGGLSKVWDIRGHEGPVKCLQASAMRSVGGGFMLYSGSLDKTLRVWWVPSKGDCDDSKMATRTQDCVILRKIS